MKGERKKSDIFGRVLRASLRQTIHLAGGIRMTLAPTAKGLSTSMSVPMGKKMRVRISETGTTISGSTGDGLRISKRIKKPKPPKPPKVVNPEMPD